MSLYGMLYSYATWLKTSLGLSLQSALEEINWNTFESLMMFSLERHVHTQLHECHFVKLCFSHAGYHTSTHEKQP